MSSPRSFSITRDDDGSMLLLLPTVFNKSSSAACSFVVDGNTIIVQCCRYAFDEDFSCVVGKKAAAKHAVIEAVKRNINADDREERNDEDDEYKPINDANASPRVQSVTPRTEKKLAGNKYRWQ
eukprot:scaffold5674_cov142-Skeletonema_menzelii.AAC.2